MRQERTADDKVLALFARLGKPLERSEIAKELGWNKQRAAQVLLRLAQEQKVVVTPGEIRAGEAGRPPALYSLPGSEPVVPLNSRRPIIFQADTVVVTPSGREARVIRMNQAQPEFVDIEYMYVRLGHEPRATVKAALLRAFQAGRERPEPVRIALPDPATA